MKTVQLVDDRATRKLGIGELCNKCGLLIAELPYYSKHRRCNRKDTKRVYYHKECWERLLL